MKAQSRLRKALLALAGALLLLTAATASAENAVAPIDVPVVKAASRRVTAAFEFSGVVEPVQQSTLSSQTSGRIARLAVKAGDPVRAGQLLAVIDDSETRTAMQRSQAQSAQAEAELRNAQAQFQRTRELHAKGFVSAAALDTAEAAFQAAQAGRDSAAASHRQSTVAQGFTQVKAPYAGWVLDTLVQAGDLALPGKPLLTLYAPLPLRAVVEIPASRVVAALAATLVEVQIPALEGGAKWIAPAARSMLPATDPVAQTRQWRLELPGGAAGSLAPGQQVQVRLSGETERRLTVPSSAVLRRGELTAVYAVSNGGAGFVLKAVRLGASHGAAGVEVLAGLNADDAVALDPVKAGLAGSRPATSP